eukprot:3738940-Alexandrium_andersonii.AAC.1
MVFRKGKDRLRSQPFPRLAMPTATPTQMGAESGWAQTLEPRGTGSRFIALLATPCQTPREVSDRASRG